MSAENPKSVLFLCSRNTVRSPMASALVRHAFGNRIYVASAGVNPGEADSIATQVMGEMDIDIAGRTPRGIDELDDTHFDLIVALASDARAEAERLAPRLGAHVEYWPTPDPTMFEGSREMRLAAYRELKDALARRIRERFGNPRDSLA
jgi:protein-tyrosine-phosphatase